MADAEATKAAAAVVAAAGTQLLAKMPSGQPISTDFLSNILGGPPIVCFRVDESSIIQGRHSTTFRLHLDRHESKRLGKGGQGALPDSNNGSLGGSSSTWAPDQEGGESTGGCGPTSVFVKRMVCDELPARSLAKWR